jgi:hypothetical protein
MIHVYYKEIDNERSDQSITRPLLLPKMLPVQLENYELEDNETEQSVTNQWG